MHCMTAVSLEMSDEPLYIVPNSIQNSLMVRMKEKTSYIIVTEQFKKLCESANLKGINLIEEGASIYTNI